LIEPRSITRFGDSGIIVRFDRRPSRKLTQHLVHLCAAARTVDGVIDAVPGHQTVLVEIESARHDAIKQKLHSLSSETAKDFDARFLRGRVYAIPLRYNGPDVDWACDHLGIELDELVRRHSEKTYDVRMLGSPKFVYLSSVSGDLSLPRLNDPRLEVPAGSVGIGGRQTGIYALARPGGWRLVGSATSQIPEVVAGDRVRFVPE
jgi:KipI family sensor histidine kinase inhibitor